MIKVLFYINSSDSLCGFKITNHSHSIICSAVSMLAINTVNSIEQLTKVSLEYSYNEDGGFIECLLPGLFSGVTQPDGLLLLESMRLGIFSVKMQYGDNSIYVDEERLTNPKKLSEGKNLVVYKR